MSDKSSSEVRGRDQQEKNPVLKSDFFCRATVAVCYSAYSVLHFVPLVAESKQVCVLESEPACERERVQVKKEKREGCEGR